MKGGNHQGCSVFCCIVDQTAGAIAAALFKYRDHTADSPLGGCGIRIGLAFDIDLTGICRAKAEFVDKATHHVETRGYHVLAMIGVIYPEQMQAPLPAHCGRLVVFQDCLVPCREPRDELAVRRVVAGSEWAEHRTVVGAIHKQRSAFGNIEIVV